MKYLRILKLHLFLFSIISSSSAFSQDLIITNSGDSLNCKITKIKKDFIFFTFQNKDVIRNSLLPMNQVKYYQPNFYPKTNIPEEKIKKPEIYSNLRLGINGGWSYRLQKISDNVPSSLQQYMKKLRSGYNFGGDITYYISEQLGIGLKTNSYKSNNKIDNTINLSGGLISNGASDDIYIGFIGPAISNRYLNISKQTSFSLNLSIGYMTYEDYTFLISYYTIKGKTIGMCWDIGYDIYIAEDYAIGFQLSCMLGILKQVEIFKGNMSQKIKLEPGNYENLSRIDLSIGIRILR